jgi:hypothetical protein
MPPRYFNLLIGYLLILHICPILDVFNMLPGGKPAYIVDLATLFPLLLGLHYLNSAVKRFSATPLDLSVGLYVALSILSVVLYLQTDNPSDIQAYFFGIHHFVLPISLFFAVKALDRLQQLRLLRLVCALNLFAIGAGILLFFLKPAFYYTFLVEKLLVSLGPLEDWQVFGRMQSYLGSTAIGSLAGPTIILFVVLDLPRKRVMFLLPVVLIGVALTYQRGGFVATAIATLYALAKLLEGRFVKALPVLMSLTLLVLGIYGYTQMDENSLDRLVDKYSPASLYESLGADRRGYGPGLSYFSDFPMGVGLGATSSVADSVGLTARGQVVDANFMRILADLGLMGLLSFLLVLWCAGKAALRRRNGFGWALLFGLIAAICIGTNTLDSYYISHCFWIFVGAVDGRLPASYAAAARPEDHMPGKGLTT